MATYVPDALARTRMASRWNFTRANIWAGPVAPPPMEPTPETTLEALKRSLARALGPADPLEDPYSDALRRARLSEPHAIPTEPPPRKVPTDFKGAVHTFNFPLVTVAGVGNAVTVVTQVFSLPMIVRRVLISCSMTTEFQAELLVSTALSLNPTVAEVRAAQQIWPDPACPGYLDSVFAVAAGAPFAVPLDTVISTIPFRIACTLVNTLAGPYTAEICVTAQDFDPQDLRVISVPVIMTPQVFTRSVSTAPLPKPKGAALPRGLKVSVLQAGQPIYSRDIAWACADPELKRQFLNAQLTGQYPPTLQPIW